MTGPDHDFRALAHRAGGWDRLVGLLIPASLGLLVAGLWLPFFAVDRFYFWTDAVSILQGVRDLLQEGEWLVALVVVLFSMVFPAAKLTLAWVLWSRTAADAPRLRHRVEGLERLAKWSMADVLVVAFAVMAAKASGLAEIRTREGLYCFVASVLLSGLALWRLRVLAHRHGGA